MPKKITLVGDNLKRFNKAMKIANGKKSSISHAIYETLKDLDEYADRARICFLWRTLNKKMREAMSNKKTNRGNKWRISKKLLVDARKHELYHENRLSSAGDK